MGICKQAGTQYIADAVHLRATFARKTGYPPSNQEKTSVDCKGYTMNILKHRYENDRKNNSNKQTVSIYLISGK